jgi:hypothetical protein
MAGGAVRIGEPWEWLRTYWRGDDVGVASILSGLDVPAEIDGLMIQGASAVYSASTSSR